MKNIITGLLSKAYKFEDGKIAELLKNGETLTPEQETEVLNAILEADQQRVENIKKSVDTKSAFQDGFKKAQSEVLTNFEKELKEKFGIESANKGAELIEDLIKVKTANGGGSDLTEDAIKRSSVYQDLMTKYKTDTEQIKADFQGQIDEIQNGYKYEKTFNEVQQKALNIFNSLNPVLPTTKAVADNQINNFINSLKNGYKYEVQENRIVVLDQNGKVIEDAHGNSRSFDEIVKEQVTAQFELAKNNGGSGAGNGNNGGSSGGGSYTTPKTYEELEKLINDPSIKNEDRLNLIDEFEKSQKGL